MAFVSWGVLHGVGVSFVNALSYSLLTVVARDQMHVDLYTDNQADEVKRLVDRGAGYVRHNEDPGDDYVVLTDPEGNPFCVCAVASSG